MFETWVVRASECLSQRQVKRHKTRYTLKRNKNATLFQWKIHGLLFKVLDRDNESSCFQEMHMNSTKHCLE